MERHRVKRNLARIYEQWNDLVVDLPRRHTDIPVIESLRGAINAIDDVVYVVDRSFRIVLVNAAWDRFALQNGGAAITSARAVGTHLLDYIHGPERDEIAAACQALFQGELAQYLAEFDCSSPSEQRTMKLLISPLQEHDGRIVGAVFLTRDVTAAKRLEAVIAAKQQELQQTIATLQRREARANLLQQIAEALNTTQTLSATLQVIIEAAMSEAHMQAAAVYLATDERQSLVLGSSWGLDMSANHDAEPDARTSLADEVFRRQQTLILDSPATLQRFKLPVLQSRQATTVAALPIVAPDGIKGVLEVYSAQQHAFDADQLALLQALANQAAAAIRNAHSFERERRRAALLRMLNQVGERLASELDEQAILAFLPEVAVEQLGLAFVRIWLFDQASQELILRSSAGMYTALSGDFSRIKLGERTIGKIAAMRQVYITQDVAAEPGLGERDWALATGIRSFGGYPLIARGHLVGVVGFFSHEPLDAELAAMLESLAHQVAVALERAWLYVGQVGARREAQRLARLAGTRAAQLTATLTAMADGVWTCDAQGRLLMVNDAALKMVGVPPLQSPPATVDDILKLFTLDSVDREHCFGLPAALRGEVVTNELTLLPAASGKGTLIVATSATPIRDVTGAILGAVAVVRDVTEQQGMERLKDVFLSAAAHELKTPVTAIKGYTQLALMRLRTNADIPRLERALRTIDEQADRITHLVQELLDMSRIHGGRLELQPTPIDLVEVINEVLADMRSSPIHQFVVSVPPRVPVLADRLRIAQVLQNLVDNAIKYSPDGGLIEVVLKLVGGEAHLTVRDYGIGIAPDKQAHVFDTWFQAHAESVGDVGGLGLGLSICKTIVERHGGRMWVHSTEGRGSTFGVALPLDPTGR